MHSNCLLNPSSGALINLHNPVLSPVLNHSWAAAESCSCSAVGHWIKWCEFANSSLFSILGLWSKVNHEGIWWSWSAVYFSSYFSPWIILFPQMKSCTLFVGIYQKIQFDLSLFWWKLLRKDYMEYLRGIFKITSTKAVWKLRTIVGTS